MTCRREPMVLVMAVRVGIMVSGSGTLSISARELTSSLTTSAVCSFNSSPTYFKVVLQL